MSNCLTGKTVILGVGGGIAAYKCCELVRLLSKAGANVHVILTKSGAKFVTPLTLQTLSQNPVHTEIFESRLDNKIDHISLADRADLLLVAPASANLIARTCAGHCDDLLTTVICATKAAVVFSPAMNCNMWENKIVQRNISTLKELGYHFIEPANGELACGYQGLGRLAEPNKIIEQVINLI
jgi:phosphopantothenoylcysteine decarboxylase/phosphopantothenate--cysteine ligase